MTDSLAAILPAAMRGGQVLVAERLVRLGPDASYRTLVAEIGSSVVGVAGVGILRRITALTASIAGSALRAQRVYGRLLVLAVDDKRRGHGIGRALVEAAEQWAMGQGASVIVVNSGHHRRDAHQFYERAAYRSTGVRFAKRLAPGV